jgi:hypothetical protein
VVCYGVHREDTNQDLFITVEFGRDKSLIAKLDVFLIEDRSVKYM